MELEDIDYFLVGTIIGIGFGVFAAFYNPYLIIPFLGMLFIGWVICK